MRRFRRLSLSVPVALLVMVVSAASVTADQSARHARQDYPPRPGGTPFVIGIPPTQPQSGAGSTALTSVQATSAAAIARHDTFVIRLVAGRRTRQSTTTPWLNSRNKLLGAIVRLPLAKAAKISGQWLALRRKPYSATYRHVVALRAFVDVRQGQVVALVPTTK